jgi:hypothetical protein
MFNNFYRSNNPKLENLMEVGLQRYNKGIHIVATMLKNLTSSIRKYTIQDFIEQNSKPDILPFAKENETKILIFADTEESKKYEFYNLDLSPRKVLKHVCKYKTERNWTQVFEHSHKNMDQKKIYNEHMYNWLYYASFSPIWLHRIEKYQGEINHANKCVNFEDTMFENFYEIYEYELDEQSIEVQNKMLHTSILPQYNINDFYKKFEKNIIIRKLKRVNNKSSKGKQDTSPYCIHNS